MGQALRESEGATMRAILVLCLFLSGVSVAEAQLYQCRDAQGKTVYRDVPCAGAPQTPLIPSQHPALRPRSQEETDRRYEESQRRRKEAERQAETQAQ
jgi:hypothetical protein